MKLKNIIAATLTTCMTIIASGDVTYTGADANDPSDLSLASNWSAAPTSEDTATIDMSAATGTDFTLGGPLSLKGISFVNVSAAITLAGSGTLTLGEGGITLNAGKNFTLKAPVVTTAPQTWNFTLNGGVFTCGAKISGNGTLNWIANSITIAEPPDYNGRIEVKSANKWNSYFQITKLGRIAASLKTDGHFYQNFSGEWSPSELVDDGYLNLSGWNHPYFNANPSAIMKVGNGEEIFNNGDLANFCAGKVIQTGGEVRLSSQVALGLPFWGGANNNPFEYSISGGIFQSTTQRTETVTLALGLRNTSGKASIRFNQSGGTVKFKTAVYIGGLGGTSTSICEYDMTGGLFVPARPKSDELNGYCTIEKKGLVFASNLEAPKETDADYGQTSVGIFNQSGGTSDVLRVRWGDNQKDSYSGVSPTSVLEGFGIFDLSGGTLEIGEDGFCVCSSTWNTDSTGAEIENPNSAYRIRLRGGTLSPETSLENKMQWEIEPSEDPDGFTLDAGDKDVSLIAPIWGAGTFRKTGTGRLFVNDMSRFTGSFIVDGGSAELRAVYQDQWEDGAVIFTGDGAAAGLESATNNAPVAAWTANDGGITATEITPGEGKWKPQLPLLATNAFNGHAGLAFLGSGLVIPTEINPIKDQTNWSAVVVFKDKAGGFHNDNANNYNWCYGRILFGNTIDGTWQNNEYALAYAKTASTFTDALVFGVGYKDQTAGNIYLRQAAPKGDLDDGEVHVAICSMSGNRTMLNVDGCITNVVKTEYTGSYPRLNKPLYIGLGRTGDSIDNITNQAFRGTMAEIRFYTNRVLTVSEQNGLIRALYAKYSGNDSSAISRDFKTGATGAIMPSGSAPALPDGANVWKADDIEGDDREPVTSWTSDTSITAGVAAGGGLAAPALVRNALNGHAALRFSSEDKTALGVSAADSPISGKSSFSVAVVFKTETDATDENVARGGMGIVSTVSGSDKAADFAISLQKEGSVFGLYGGEYRDVSCWTRKPCRLADGTPHITILSADAEGSELRLMTDGLICRKTLDSASNRGSHPLLFGSLSAALDKHFTGDIAAVAIWGHALTEEEMTTATEHFAAEYAFRPLAKNPFESSDIKAYGIGATNISVSAGAKLILPASDTAAFALGAGQTVSGDGAILGTVKFGAGSSLDFSRENPAIDDIRLDGCTLIFPEQIDAPFVLPGLSEVSGTITVDFSAWTDLKTLPPKINLMAIPPAVVSEGTVFQAKGVKSNSQVIYDAETGTLRMHTLKGFFILVK